MKAVILAGGLGTRLSEETELRPKPMVEIGGRPIIWHIMKIYSHYGFNEFVLCLGYKGYMIKEYFHHYFLHHSDVSIDLGTNSVVYHNSSVEPWKITLIDTGIATMTGGRIKRIQQYLNDETFLLTYGDGLSNIDLNSLVDFHRVHKKIGTVTAVQPSGRFGALEIDNVNRVKSFVEKPSGDKAWINGGFFVFEPRLFQFLDGDDTILEKEPLQRLSSSSELAAYKHEGFWQAMDTLREKRQLEELWQTPHPPWKIW